MSSIKPEKTVQGRETWRSLEQKADSPEFRKWVESEFPYLAPDVAEDEQKLSRRGFLSVMGASFAMAGLVGCRKPIEKIVPYVDQPEYMVLGEEEQYATLMPFGTTAYGLLVTSYEGRPTKVEGNPLHPASKGRTNAWMQGEILNLYDPDRSKWVLNNGQRSNWDSFKEAWTTKAEELATAGGEGLAFLVQPSNSPTLSRLKREILNKYPRAQWVCREPVCNENQLAGVATALNREPRFQPVYHLENAKTLLAIDSDFLMTEPDNVRNALGFSEGRKVDDHHEMNRLYVVESGYSVTGAAADHRLRMKSGNIAGLLPAVADELRKHGLNLPELPSHKAGTGDSKVDPKWVAAVAEDLLAHRGEAAVLVGRKQPAPVHALALAINEALGNLDKTVTLHPMPDADTSNSSEFSSLVGKLNGGTINTLVLLGGDPAVTAPGEYKLNETLKNIDTTIHLGTHANATSNLCTWHIPQTHFMEAWGDARSSDGTAGIVQPLIAPLFGGRSEVEFRAFLARGEDDEAINGHDIVKETWNNLPGGMAWETVLHDGLWKGSANTATGLRVNRGHLQDYLSMHWPDPQKGGIEAVFVPDNTLYDGRYANNGWLQELPDPITKLAWDNAALVSPKTANELGLKNGHMVRLSSSFGRTLEIPVWIQPGHADHSLTLPLGYGFQETGRIANTVGFDTFSFRSGDELYILPDINVEALGSQYMPANMQEHGSMEGRPLALENTLEGYHHDPKFAQHAEHVPPLQSLWDEHTYDSGNQWGMTVDLNACIGCGACTVACQSENNIPVVGKEPASYGREMQWMRMDRYYVGDENDPQVIYQPVACQHCEMAPCEQVCPVAATVHDEEGLNVMTYNRCIGTRYCSNNCPYKARRFNFYNYTKAYPDTVKMAQNPDVTVRSRGVMEKCTYCLQRIMRAKRHAKVEGRELRTDEVVAACQQACPTNAISFGNILDPEAKVRKEKKKDRNYEILAQINTRPRTSYLAKIRNPNPKLIQPTG